MVLNKNTQIVVENTALSGVKKVAMRVAADMQKVFGGQHKIVDGIKDAGDNYIIAATCGYSDIANELDLADIAGKREVYKYVSYNGKLAIIGSDKRGTIYGLFHLSELFGVSPLVDWFKLMPGELDEYEVAAEEYKASKEPSVRYRGLFINDEWPAFGNWCTKNFGGFNAKAYEEIFYLLLRMKGNYMWPAMWSAIFPNDGPGLLNEELADELGVVMGMSHHEPCLRQGEEYRYLRGEGSIYGDAWNFRTNEEGITRFWEDGLKRSGKFENVITVGMRGEADTAIMGKDATLKDNIDLLRDVLKTQNRLIRENVNANLDAVPRMLALYKEVEPYFYGDEQYKGLMDDPELEGVTLMLCDDNYGNLRTVPTEHMRSHKGGYGMYYHFDYHGFPISFEWVNSSYLPKVWEQMTTAYEYGIRDLWIVNVGDLFTQEYPLAYFLDLAYDYDKWGINNLNSAKEYTEKFIAKAFGARTSAAVQRDMYDLLMGYTKIAHARRPEAMNTNIYAPFAYGETADLLAKIEELEVISDRINDNVCEDLKYPVFELMYYPARANLNVQKLWLYTGLNHEYAKLGDTRADKMAKLVDECLDYDVDIVNKLHEIDNGRWYGMGLSEHIGFKHWCEEECSYPVLHTLKAGNKPRIIVSIPDTNQHTEGGVWTAKVLTLDKFLTPGVDEASIELSIAGAKDDYTIECDKEYLTFDNVAGSVNPGESVIVKVSLDRAKYDGEVATIIVHASAGNSVVKVPVANITVEEANKKYQSGTFLWCQDYISMEAGSYTALGEGKCADKSATFKEIPGYGKTVSAVKAFPVDATFTKENAPSVTYTFEVLEDGEYVIDAYMNPSNAPFTDGRLFYGIKAGDEEYKTVNALPEGFKVGDNQADWSKGVLDNIRISSVNAKLKAGVNNVTYYSLNSGFVLEKVVIYKKNCKPMDSYLGPKATYQV